MFTGERFRLKLDTIGIGHAHDKRIAMIVPAGEVVRVLSCPRADDPRLVDVLWRNRTVTMFAQDIEQRGAEVRSRRSWRLVKLER